MITVHDGKVLFNDAASDAVRSLGIHVERVTVGRMVFDALPHTNETVTLFSNLGAVVPEPISMNYKFPGLFRPYEHQKMTSSFLVKHERAFCLSSPGVGKTASAIWAADYLMTTGVIKKVLVLCPLSCTEAVWGDELFGIVPKRKVVVLSGSGDTKRKLLNLDYEWAVTNHDAAGYIDAELVKQNFDLVIVDESTNFKSEGARRSKGLKAILKKGCRVWMMTGTPIPQNPVDAHFPCKLINPNTPPSKGWFQEITMRKVTQYKWVPRPNAIDIVKSYMQPAIRFDKADCLDMPPITYIRRRVPLTKMQEATIKDFREESMTERMDSDTPVVADNAAIMGHKLLQVYQGILIGNDGVVHDIDSGPRIDACMEFIDQSVGKTIIFATYRGAVAKLQAALSKHYGAGAVAYVDGEVTGEKRRDIFSRFQTDATLRVLVAHPRVAAHGLTLTAATTTIWYGPTSAEFYEQANNRMSRPGQVNDMLIVDLWCTHAELAVFNGVKERVDMQKLLLDLVKRELETGD